MLTMERALTQMLEYLRESLPLLQAPEDDLRRGYFILFYTRLLELIDAALRLTGQTRDWAPTNVLLRSALECSIDLCNLAQQPGYEHVVRAMMLENRSALFHFKSQPAYGELVDTYGPQRVQQMGAQAEREFKQALREATEHFPILNNSSRNLSVLTRFRIAGQEERYQTEYTLLSMVTHNDMTVLTLQDALRTQGSMDAYADERAWEHCLRFLVDALKYKTQLFGPDDELIQACLGCLEVVRQKQARKEKEHKE